MNSNQDGLENKIANVCDMLRPEEINEILSIIHQEILRELDHVDPDARWFPNGDLYGVITVEARKTQLRVRLDHKGDR